MKNQRLGLGALLCVSGALGFILGFALGLADLRRPWGFLVGFGIGIIAGIGAALSISGLAGLKRIWKE